MAKWFETRLRYKKIDERGKQKKVTDHYLVDALSFTEAEARIIKEMEPYIEGDFDVSAVKKAKIDAVIPSDAGGWWYKLRAVIITIDERTGTEKRTPHEYIVQADNVEEAIMSFKSEVNILIDYKIAGITETPILDVFPVELSKSN